MLVLTKILESMKSFEILFFHLDFVNHILWMSFFIFAIYEKEDSNSIGYCYIIYITLYYIKLKNTEDFKTKFYIYIIITPLDLPNTMGLIEIPDKNTLVYQGNWIIGQRASR